MESKTPLYVMPKSKWSAKILYKEVNYPAAKNVNGWLMRVMMMTKRARKEVLTGQTRLISPW